MALTILEAEALCFAYGKAKWAIDHVNLALQEGDRLELLGANGAGKSTFLHLLIGLHSPCGGTLRLEGSPISADARGRRLLRRSVGLVLQDPDDQLFADTVEADVIFGPLNSGLDRDAAEAVGRSAIGTMRISHLATRRVSSLTLPYNIIVREGWFSPACQRTKPNFFGEVSERRPWALNREDRPAAFAGRSESVLLRDRIPVLPTRASILSRPQAASQN
jgi:ABC transporter